MVASLKEWLDTAIKRNFEAMNKALRDRTEKKVKPQELTFDRFFHDQLSYQD
jgi:hypothetical protein